MCGRYNLRATPQQLAEFFALLREPAWEPRYNIAPTQLIGAVRRLTADGPREWTTLRWGLIPSWSKDASGASHMINARAETVADKPAFRVPFRRKRCLIPASGYYEWQSPSANAESSPTSRRPLKQPFLISRKDEPLMAFAGLWDQWRNPEGTTWETGTILTTEASAGMSRVHDRMPVILSPEDFDLWLDPSQQDPDELRGLLMPLPADSMQAVPVSTVVNNARHESPECVTPSGPPLL